MLGPAKKKTGLIFKSITERRLLKRLKELCEQCEFENPRQYKLHSFRHHFGSLCANHNVAYRKALAWLGHSSSQMLDLYYHLHDEDSQQAMVALANSSVVDGCFGSQYFTFEGNGAVKNRENVASPASARTCDDTIYNNGEAGIRTRGTVLPVRRFSKPLPSATRSPLQAFLMNILRFSRLDKKKNTGY